MRARIDVNYLLGLELTDPGFERTVLTGFRHRLPARLAAVRSLKRLEFVGEMLRAVLEALVAAAPDWTRVSMDPVWQER